MDKYINKLIRGFKKIFSKKYFAVVSVFIGIITVLGFTYGYFSSESGWQLAAQLKIRSLYYTMTIDGQTKSSITAPANSGTTYHDIVITSLNDINTRYSLTYKSNISGVTVDASSRSINKQEGVIGLYTTGTTAEKTKTIRVAVTNNTATDASVTFNVAGGYTWNPENEVAIQTGYSRITNLNNEVAISGGLTLAEEINSILNCTPTSSKACLYKENSNNYLSYAGQTWRIVGTYYMSSKYVVKLVLDSNYGALGTYSARTTKLNTFYNSVMTDRSLVRTSSYFTCSGTTSISCTSGSANIGSISKAEYDAIGGVNSYLYTKPNENYWTQNSYYVGTSRGISNLTSTTTAYTRPAIYLKPEVVNAHSTGEYGTATNPYEIVEGVQVTFNGLTEVGATTNLSSGYYAPGQTYTLNNPTTSNTIYTFKQWVVSGTGSSVSGTSFTMGTAATTLTATWTGTYNYTGTYKTYVATVDGTYYIETKGAQGGDVSSTLLGGRGGLSSGYVTLPAGTTLYVYVGSQGSVTSQTANQTAAGGWNGGGSGMNHASATGRVSAGGGGATDIRYFGTTTPTSSDLQWNSTLGLNSRIMVAGGGGGSFTCATCPSVYSGVGGAGGGLQGGYSQGISVNSNGALVAGGSQVANNFGVGANGSAQQPGGGGGYYGGNVGSFVAGGGSSFISGYAGCNAITSSSDRTPQTSGSTHVHYSNKYFYASKMKMGVNEGNGSAFITYVSSVPSQTKSLPARYVKSCISASSSNTGNHWVEIQAIGFSGGLNFASPSFASLSGSSTNSYINDGNIVRDNYASGSAGANQCVTVDLAGETTLNQIGVWHFEDNRVYFDRTVSISSNNSTWTKVIYDDGPETYSGSIVDAHDQFYADYTRANYITVNGQTSLNSGVKPSRRTTVYVDASVSSITSQKRIISSAGDLYFQVYINANSQWASVIQDTTGTNGWTSTSVAADTNRHMFILSAMSRHFSVYRSTSAASDRVAYTDLSSYTHNNTGSQNIYLFGQAGSNYMSGNIYSAKIVENWTIVRDFIPATRKSDSAVGMYDRVTETFFPISGAVAH